MHHIFYDFPMKFYRSIELSRCGCNKTSMKLAITSYLLSFQILYLHKQSYQTAKANSTEQASFVLAMSKLKN